MKTKSVGNPRSERLLKAVHSVSTLLRKKKPKHHAPKKTVRFNLMARSSSSEVMLTWSKPVHLMKPDLNQGWELRSQSCVNMAGPSALCRPHDSGPLTNMVDPCQTQLRVSKMRRLQKYIKCFNDLYLLEPVLNLQRKVPVKGILKNVQNCWNTYRNHGDTLSTRKPLQTLTDQRESKVYCHSDSNRSCVQPSSVFKFQSNNENTNRTEVVQRNIFENLMASIHGLHISAPCQGDEGRKVLGITKGQPCFNFVTCIPRNSSQVEHCHSLVSYVGLDSAPGML